MTDLVYCFCSCSCKWEGVEYGMAHRCGAEEGMCAFFEQDTRNKLFVQPSVYKEWT